MNELELQRNNALDRVLYLQLMYNVDLSLSLEDSFYPILDRIWKDSYDEKHTAKSWKETIDILDKQVIPLLAKYPLKTSLAELAKDYYEITRFENNNLTKYGIQIGWIRDRMDFSNFLRIDDFPYQTYIGFGKSKGAFGIEEDMLLKDAFNVLVKSIKLYENSVDIGKKINKLDKTKKDTLKRSFSSIQFDMACYSRLSIISFFAFLESFINSIGYSYLKENEKTLSESEKNNLQGLSNNGRNFTSLKKRIEKFQTIMRSDQTVHINLSDPNQISDPFKKLFDSYKDLRDSSMHNSPLKEKIWLSAFDWNQKAKEFSHLTIECSKVIWKTLKDSDQLPLYLEKLDYDELLKASKKRLLEIEMLSSKFR